LVGIPEIFRIQLKDLPALLVEEVRRATGDYTLPIVSEQTPLGSGTLVQIDEWQGILTARHVVQPDKADLRLDRTGHPERLLRTAVGPFAHDLSISTNALRFVITPRKTQQYGPDLAFIVLPPGAFLEEIAARKSFYNLSKSSADRKATALTETGFFALCGFPRVKDFSVDAELGLSIVQGLYGYCMLTGPEGYEHHDQWDYYEMGVSQQAANEFKRSFGGVSGGGVWRINARRKKEDKPGQEILDSMTFAGVAFYEIDDVKAERFTVRAHGPVSIYDRLIDEVRQHFGY
jgi:hypothetical protein